MRTIDKKMFPIICLKLSLKIQKVARVIDNREISLMIRTLLNSRINRAKEKLLKLETQLILQGRFFSKTIEHLQANNMSQADSRVILSIEWEASDRPQELTVNKKCLRGER